MIHSQACLCLPLVNHFMQHGVLNLGPRMPVDVSPADPDLGWPSSFGIDRKLSEPASHPPRQPDRDLAQSSTELPKIELAVESLQPMQQGHVSRSGSLSPRRPLNYRHVRCYGELEELAFCRAPEDPRYPRIQKPNHCSQHIIRSEAIPPVDPENPPIETQHYGPVGMSYDSFDIPEAQPLQPLGKAVLE